MKLETCNYFKCKQCASQLLCNQQVCPETSVASELSLDIRPGMVCAEATEGMGVEHHEEEQEKHVRCCDRQKFTRLEA